jgi:hypothetical protein
MRNMSPTTGGSCIPEAFTVCRLPRVIPYGIPVTSPPSRRRAPTGPTSCCSIWDGSAFKEKKPSSG